MGDTTKGGTPAGVIDMTRAVDIKLPTGRQTWTRPRPGSPSPQAKNKGGYLRKNKGGSPRKG